MTTLTCGTNVAFPTGAFPSTDIQLYSNNSLSGNGVTSQVYAHRFLANSDAVEVTSGGVSGLSFIDVTHNFGGGATRGWRQSVVVTQTMTGVTENQTNGINPINTSLTLNQGVQVNDGGTGLQANGRTGSTALPQNNSTALGIQSTLYGSATYQSGQLGIEIDVGGRTGYSVRTKKGLLICKWSTDDFQSPVDDAAIVVTDQGGATVGWTSGLRFGSSESQWPIDTSNGSIIGAAYSGGSVVAGARYGINFQDVGFAAFNTTARAGAFNSNGFAVDGVGAVMIGTGYLTAMSIGLSIDTKGSVATGASVNVGGTGWLVGDIAYDPYGGIWKITSVSAGVVIGLAVLTDGQGHTHYGNYPSTTAPSNPITLTPWDHASENASGLTVNMTWDTTATMLQVQGSGGVTSIGSNLNTGTATYSLVHGIQSTDAGRKGSRGFSSGARWTAGDVLVSEMTLRATTNSTTSTLVATSDGAAAGTANQFTLQSFTGVRLDIRVVARDTNGSNFATWHLNGCLAKRGNAASTVALAGTPTFTQDGTIGTTSGWGVTVSADTTNGAVAVMVTGNSDTIDWAVHVTSLEVN